MTLQLILPAFITVLALLLYAGVCGNVLRARQRSGIRAPAVIGAADFERAFRVQQNTLEQLVLFVPALWLFSFFISPLWGAGIGLVWIIGRIVYAVSYVRDPERRLLGFAIGWASALILLIGALVGVVRALWLISLV
jgi:glutathione S-transferase